MSKPVILCVDDETVILESLKAQLRKALGSSYAYEVAQDAEEALDIIDELNEDNISILLIISDWLMPGMKGDEFLISVHQKFPKIVKILLTGQANKEAIERAYAEANVHKCLFKPWSPNELLDIVKSGLEKL
ncbi:MAG: response regulator [Microcoleus sp. PH2017_10_PVI_O_A]|uniref:response regulator n=1 Tax=unclassified Microcoleus TaxID=2642155 RepID=UPI001D6ABC36|nr:MULTISPECIES: response regulator [unclassified Microcoleus]TAE82270.1 MAG: response regulator [Oscillatoriales cyanobacterium]MCC3406790.1 response regulator [Microcoleus sp. PH2017_10_PVI_O_A]MCC3460925.1 response regulator [Microcoleus sp. PH2017_11_PCY_U_A]MCC3479447.1 response regulator [Microcoleus sp. PH2017_12_PCY_D_A]MCC3526836.1 response regulator [Microcoleus sp. PH2017_21_RUC_O_A]